MANLNANAPLAGAQLEVRRILRSFTLDPEGIIHLGNDGILRSLDADRNVLNAAALEPRLLKAFLDRMPWSKDAEDRYRGVDGTKTPREQWYNPDLKDLPPPLASEKRLTQERKDEVRRLLKERDEVLAKQDEAHVDDGCPVVRSDYDLGPEARDKTGD